MAVFTAIGATIFGAGTFAAAITAAGLQIAAGVAFSLIGKSLAGQPQADGRPFSTQVSLRSGDTIGRTINFGWNVTAGSLVYYNTWGTSNAFVTQVFALGDMPVSSLVDVWVDDANVTLLTGETHADYGWPVAEYRKAGVDHLWVKFYDGTQIVADPFLVSTVSSADYPYENTRVGYGVPYAIVTARAPARMDGEERPLFSGIPRAKFETYGVPLFDPSDETQDWDNPETWGGPGDFNPVVQIYNVLRGIYYEGIWLYGAQNMPAARLPLDNWVAQIEKAQAAIDGPDGPEPTYRSGGEINVNTQIRATIEALMTTCQGRLSEVGGVYRIFVGEPDAAVFSFDDDDIISTEVQSFTPFLGLADTVNGISATFPNPAEGWADKTLPALRLTTAEARVGNRSLMASVALDLVPYGAQGQRLILSALNEAQRERRHTLTLGPEAWVLQPGDTIERNSIREGYVNKLFRVDGTADRANLDVLLDITEVDPSDYDWNQGTDYTPQIDGPLVLVPPPPLLMSGWQVFPATIYDEDADPRRPAIEVRFASGLTDVRSVRVQVRVVGETDPMFDGEVPYSAPFKVILSGQFSPNTAYEVRGIFIRESMQESSWSAWLDVTTPNVMLVAGKDFDPFDTVTGFEQLNADLDGYQNWIGQNLRELIEQAQAQATLTAGQELANSLQLQELRRVYSAQLGELDAVFQEVITVSIVPIEGQLVALADALTELSAGDGGDVNTARWRMTTMTGPTGYSRIGLETRQDDSEGFVRGAALYLDTPNSEASPTRVLIDAQQFVLIDSSDPDNVEAPFVFEDGEAKMVAARIGTVTAGRLEGPGGASFWDLTGGGFRLST